MYTAGKLPASPNRTNEAQSSTVSQTGATSANDIYRFFRKDADKSAIDASFAPTFFEPVTQKLSDVERLDRYQKLKSLVEPEHLDKIKLQLTSDYSTNTWSYGFSFNGSDLYRSESCVMGYGKDLIAYQNEYFLQAFLEFSKLISIHFVHFLFPFFFICFFIFV